MFRSPEWQLQEAARSSVEHLEAKVQQNLTHRLYGANGQSPEAFEERLSGDWPSEGGPALVAIG
jgi:hypothetical protein